MGENSKIEWTTHTFNPWVGCTKVSPACDGCYAEAWASRSGKDVWGPHADRQRTKTWGNPVKWNKAAAGASERPRVFCASLADVFDNHKSILPRWRSDLWNLIDATTNLDWLLLTKRPQNILKYVPESWRESGFPDHVWIGTTVENQEEADRRIPHLVGVNARVRFLSCEPLLGEVDLSLWLAVHRIELNGRPHWTERTGEITKLHWVITGGESGPNYRPANADWFRSLRDQCSAADVPFLFKQWEGKTQPKIKSMGRELDGREHNGYPQSMGAPA